MQTFIKHIIIPTLLLSLSFCLNFASPAKQQLAHTPKDTKIQITTHDNQTYCYTPSFGKAEGYIYLDHCSRAKPARYDVFHRVAWNVNNIWLCMTAPESVIKSKKGSGNLLLRPCVLNDKNQQWLIKDGAFYTMDLAFRVQDYQWYVHINAKQKAYNHTLKDMQQWIDTIAAPPTLSIKTFIGWSFISPTQFSLYYLQNNQSFQDSLVELIYNPENGHIAQYNPNTGGLACMASRQGKHQDWNWIVWASCNDKVFAKKESIYWEFFRLSGSQGALRDRDGNFLRLTQYGPNWGVPYTAKPSFIERDHTNAPKSLFLFNADIERWSRYVDSNLGDMLSFCPAPGAKHLAQTQHKRAARSLPPSFRLNEEWIKRFYQIGATSDGRVERIGVCGVCLLQSFQIIAELESFHSTHALSSGGYFFDTAPHTSPFTSFRARYPALAARLGELVVTRPALEDRESYHLSIMRNFEAMAQTMLPGFVWRASTLNEAPEAREQMLQTMLNAPLGSLWIVSTYTRDAGGNRYGHALPALRMEDGLMFIPTNLPNMTFTQYVSYIRQNSIARNVQEAIRVLTPRGRVLEAVAHLQITQPDPNPLNISISNSNCTGEGDNRHGSAAVPLSSSINQCSSGRCVLQ